MNIKRVKIFCNNNIKSNSVKNVLVQKLLTSGFEITEDEFDLGIAIGGDGSFLRMVKSSYFNSDVYYIGIHTGTLGFAQEVDESELDDFILKLKNNQYKVEKIGVGEVSVCSDLKEEKMYFLNDVTVRDSELNTTKLDISVDNYKLENFVGDGILVSTSFGSTAYNLSFGGSIVYNTLHTLQITPIAPLNSKVFSTLRNSIVIPQNQDIIVKPSMEVSNLIVTVDGENIFYENVKQIELCVNGKTIMCLRGEEYNFIKKVNEKFLK